MAMNPTQLPGRFADERELDESIVALARRGMRPGDIAKHLGIPIEWVLRSPRTAPLDELDRADDGSFPASDPPSSPSA
jgi:hypothetical protein